MGMHHASNIIKWFASTRFKFDLLVIRDKTMSVRRGGMMLSLNITAYGDSYLVAEKFRDKFELKYKEYTEKQYVIQKAFRVPNMDLNQTVYMLFKSFMCYDNQEKGIREYLEMLDFARKVLGIDFKTEDKFEEIADRYARKNKTIERQVSRRSKARKSVRCVRAKNN